MEQINRRTFLKKSTAASAGVAVAPTVMAKSSKRFDVNDTINIAVALIAVGIIVWLFFRMGAQSVPVSQDDSYAAGGYVPEDKYSYTAAVIRQYLSIRPHPSFYPHPRWFLSSPAPMQ